MRPAATTYWLGRRVLVVALAASAVAALPAAQADTPLDAEIRFSSATYAVSEDAGSATITLVRGGSAAGIALVDYQSTAGTATAGADYQNVSGTLIILPTQTGASFTVPVTEDAADEAAETVNLSITVSLLGVAAPPSTAVLTIADNDNSGSTLSVSGAVVTETAGHAVFVVQLDVAAAQPVSVEYSTLDDSAVVGSDYVEAHGSVTFAPGVTTQKVAVGVVDDNEPESSEAFRLTLLSPSNAVVGTGEASALITDYTTILRRVTPVDTTYLRDLDVQGPYAGDYVVGSASPSGSVTGDLSLTGVIPNDGCGALGAGTLTGKVVLIRRGTCTFNQKVVNAQNAGAAAVLIYNTSDGLTPITVGSGLTVPVQFLTKALGESLVAQLTGGPVTMQVVVP